MASSAWPSSVPPYDCVLRHSITAERRGTVALSAHRGDIALPAAALSTPVAATCSISSVVGMLRGHIQQGRNFISLWEHGRRKREDGERVPRSRETSGGHPHRN